MDSTDDDDVEREILEAAIKLSLQNHNEGCGTASADLEEYPQGISLVNYKSEDTDLNSSALSESILTSSPARIDIVEADAPLDVIKNQLNTGSSFELSSGLTLENPDAFAHLYCESVPLTAEAEHRIIDTTESILFFKDFQANLTSDTQDLLEMESSSSQSLDESFETCKDDNSVTSEPSSLSIENQMCFGEEENASENVLLEPRTVLQHDNTDVKNSTSHANTHEAFVETEEDSCANQSSAGAEKQKCDIQENSVLSKEMLNSTQELAKSVHRCSTLTAVDRKSEWEFHNTNSDTDLSVQADISRSLQLFSDIEPVSPSVMNLAGQSIIVQHISKPDISCWPVETCHLSVDQSHHSEVHSVHLTEGTSPHTNPSFQRGMEDNQSNYAVRMSDHTSILDRRQQVTVVCRESLECSEPSGVLSRDNTSLEQINEEINAYRTLYESSEDSAILSENRTTSRELYEDDTDSATLNEERTIFRNLYKDSTNLRSLNEDITGFRELYKHDTETGLSVDDAAISSEGRELYDDNTELRPLAKDIINCRQVCKDSTDLNHLNNQDIPSSREMCKDSTSSGPLMEEVTAFRELYEVNTDSGPLTKDTPISQQLCQGSTDLGLLNENRTSFREFFTDNTDSTFINKDRTAYWQLYEDKADSALSNEDRNMYRHLQEDSMDVYAVFKDKMASKSSKDGNISGPLFSDSTPFQQSYNDGVVFTPSLDDNISGLLNEDSTGIRRPCNEGAVFTSSDKGNISGLLYEDRPGIRQPYKEGAAFASSLRGNISGLLYEDSTYIRQPCNEGAVFSPSHKGNISGLLHEDSSGIRQPYDSGVGFTLSHEGNISSGLLYENNTNNLQLNSGAVVRLPHEDIASSQSYEVNTALKQSFETCTTSIQRFEESSTFRQPSEESITLRQPSEESTTFRQSYENTLPFKQSYENSTTFRQLYDNTSPFKQSCEDSSTFRQSYEATRVSRLLHKDNEVSDTSHKDSISGNQMISVSQAVQDCVHTDFQQFQKPAYLHPSVIEFDHDWRQRCEGMILSEDEYFNALLQHLLFVKKTMEPNLLHQDTIVALIADLKLHERGRNSPQTHFNHGTAYADTMINTVRDGNTLTVLPPNVKKNLKVVRKRLKGVMKKLGQAFEAAVQDDRMLDEIVTWMDNSKEKVEKEIRNHADHLHASIDHHLQNAISSFQQKQEQYWGMILQHKIQLMTFRSHLTESQLQAQTLDSEAQNGDLNTLEGSKALYDAVCSILAKKPIIQNVGKPSYTFEAPEVSEEVFENIIGHIRIGEDKATQPLPEENLASSSFSSYGMTQTFTAPLVPAVLSDAVLDDSKNVSSSVLPQSLQHESLIPASPVKGMSLHKLPANSNYSSVNDSVERAEKEQYQIDRAEKEQNRDQRYEVSVPDIQLEMSQQPQYHSYTETFFGDTYHGLTLSYAAALKQKPVSGFVENHVSHLSSGKTGKPNSASSKKHSASTADELSVVPGSKSKKSASLKNKDKQDPAMASATSLASSVNSQTAGKRKRTRGRKRNRKVSSEEEVCVVPDNSSPVHISPTSISASDFLDPFVFSGRGKEPTSFAPLSTKKTWVVYGYRDPHLDLLSDEGEMLQSVRIGGNTLYAACFGTEYILLASHSPSSRLQLLDASGKLTEAVSLEVTSTGLAVGYTGIAVTSYKSLLWIPLDGGEKEWIVQEKGSPFTKVYSAAVMLSRGKELVCAADRGGNAVYFFVKEDAGGFSPLEPFRGLTAAEKDKPFVPMSISAHPSGFLGILEDSTGTVIILNQDQVPVSVIPRHKLCSGIPSVIAFAGDGSKEPYLWVGTSSGHVCLVALLLTY